VAQPVELWPFDRFGPLLGRSVAMRELFGRIARVAPTDAAVLIQGETGTGKELVARAIHEASPRASGPFVVVDLAAMPETLLESELFGHRKGAFTGAEANRAGAAEQAVGGTVFLDEIGELPLAVQPKLLRLLETRVVRRLGDDTERPLDVRFVAATHRDLRAAVNAQGFPDVDHVELVAPPAASGADARNFVLCPGGAYDRSPCGTGTSARLACLAADGRLAEGARWVQESIIGSTFSASYRWLDRAAGRIEPLVTGTAYVTAEATLLIDERDPYAWGIRRDGAGSAGGACSCSPTWWPTSSSTGASNASAARPRC